MGRHSETIRDKVGFVVIGRNEGDRLVKCLASVSKTECQIVYVDSGSTDGSIENARKVGAEVVELDQSIPFTAGRARNAGLDRLVEVYPELAFVHFIDGDCQLAERWLRIALKKIASGEKIAAVCGRLRELYPDASIYNALCEKEWTTRDGEVDACGGIAIMKISAIENVKGFDERLIAGEEPELCLRLRAQGYKIWRLPDDMAWHDAAIDRFGQWWRRSVRGGHAYAEVGLMYLLSDNRMWIREAARALFWGLALPLIIVLSGFIDPRFFMGFLIYPLNIARLASKDDWQDGEAWRYAFFTTLEKFPEAYGIVRFCFLKLFQRQPEIIEYKL